MADIKQQKRIAGSTAYTIGAGLLMNGVLQSFIFPYLNRHMGSEMLGSLLFIMGIAAIVCPSIGQALNTSRLVVRRTAGVVNGDYDRMLLLFGSIGGVISLVIGRSSIGSPVEAVIIFVLSTQKCSQIRGALLFGHSDSFPIKILCSLFLNP